MVVARELTKIHEEFLRGTPAQLKRGLADRDRVRGEITLLVETRPLPVAGSETAGPVKIAERIAKLQAESGPIPPSTRMKR